jgi:hypothetical protein
MTETSQEEVTLDQDNQPSDQEVTLDQDDAWSLSQRAGVSVWSLSQKGCGESDVNIAISLFYWM